MQEEMATVIETRGNTAKVRVQSSSSCDHCPSRSSCHTIGEGLREVDVSNRIGARVGQRVKIGVSPRALLKASFILYIIPIVALVIGAMLGNSFSSGNKEVWAVLLGGGFLVGSFLLIKAFGKYLNLKNEYLPTATEVLDPSSGIYQKEF
jgi:sigma-E factor negative regulatory protein RseC